MKVFTRPLWCTWGMARLAIVRPEMISERRSLRLYSGPHWKMGNKYWRARRNLMMQVWFLNPWKGSSGKKISESLHLSFWRVVLCGGNLTLWISNGDWDIGISDWILMVSKVSTLLEFPTIFCLLLMVLCAQHKALKWELKFVLRREYGYEFIEREREVNWMKKLSR